MQRYTRSLVVFSLFLISYVQIAHSAIDARLLRYPDVSEQNIVFTYAGDLWLMPIAGGRAMRVTTTMTADGSERRAKFSRDGKKLAYSATTKGNTDIFTVGIEGGIPTRVTHHPESDLILDWTADGKRLLFSSQMYSERPRVQKLFLVDANGGLPEQLPVFNGENASLSDDGTQLIYTHLRDFQQEAWKRYKGGRSPDLWFLDIKSGESKQLTDYVGPDSQPMRVADTVYYLSENGESQRSNIWSLDLASGDKQQLTFYTKYDVRHPSLGPNHLVFQNGGKLHLLSLSDKKVTTLEVDVVLEQSQLAEQTKSVASQIRNSTISPDGSTAYFEARGDIHSLDVKNGFSINISATQGVAERYPAPSPDGNSLAYFSDLEGEYQLHIKDLDKHTVRTLTNFKQGYRYQPQWSPDSKKIAFLDSEQILNLLDVASGRVTKVDQGLSRDHYSLERLKVSWSGDSRWLAYSRYLENRNQAIFAFDSNKSKLHQLTSGHYSDFDPVFDPDGNYLYLLSHRQFAPIFGDIDDTWVYANSTVLALVPLTQNVLSPLSPAWERGKASSREVTSIDVEEFEQRLVILPLRTGRYEGLQVANNKLVYMEGTMRLPDVERGKSLKYYDLEAKQEFTVLDSVGDAQLLTSLDKLLVRDKGQYRIVDLAEKQNNPVNLATANLQASINRAVEYQQMLRDVERYVRDFFYDPGVHGLDWPVVVDSYRKWLPYVATDTDMTVLLTELMAEISGGHIWGTASETRNRPWRAKNQSIGLLGVDFEVANHAYRIKKIYSGENYVDAPAAPLAEAALGVNVGDYILAVNGKPIPVTQNPWRPFVGEFEKVVRLSVSSKPDLSTARDVLVKTIASEQKLRELDWVESNRQRVAEATDDKVGYLYLPDTALNGQNDLMRQYRAQHNKAGIVVDERYNMGGALGDRLIELLNRPALNYFSVRAGSDYPLPTVGHGGPMALLTNGWSCSGGDGFPFLFKTAKLGPLIGTQTWGCLIGPNMPLSLINGGAVSVPPQRVYATSGEWAGGNEGVIPDIKVIGDPSKIFRGDDVQLDRAINEVVKRVKILPKRNRPVMPSEQVKEVSQ